MTWQLLHDTHTTLVHEEKEIVQVIVLILCKVDVASEVQFFAHLKSNFLMKCICDIASEHGVSKMALGELQQVLSQVAGPLDIIQCLPSVHCRILENCHDSRQGRRRQNGRNACEVQGAGYLE